MGVQEVFWHVHLFAFLFLLVNSLHLAASSELPTYVKENGRYTLTPEKAIPSLSDE